MTGLLRSEWFKISRRTMILILALLTAVLIGFLYFALSLAVIGSDAANVDPGQVEDLERMVALESVPAVADDLVWQIVGIMAVILIATTVGNEFGWRTILTVTTWTGDRIRPLLARYIVAALLVAGGVVLGFVVAVASSVVFELVNGSFDSATLSAGWLGDVAFAALTTWYTLLMYVAIAGLVAVLSRSSGLAIGVGLAVLFLESLAILALDLIGDAVDWVKDLTLSQNVQAVLAANGDVPGFSDSSATDLPSATQGALVLAVYLVIAVAAALYTMQRRDIVE